MRQIDITVSIPAHSSSLEFFDYVISYTDNNGTEYRDTIRKSSPDNIYMMTTFSYTSLPLTCRCEVSIVPKVPRRTRVSPEKPDIRGLNILEFEDIEISLHKTWGAEILKEFEIETENAYQTNCDFLMRGLKDNAGTEYGKRYGFADCL